MRRPHFPPGKPFGSLFTKILVALERLCMTSEGTATAAGPRLGDLR
jgi:hypothetical protein